MHNEGHPGPVHGGRVQRGQRGAVRTVHEELAVPGGRHYRADGVRLHLRRQVRRPGRAAVRRSARTPRCEYTYANTPVHHIVISCYKYYDRDSYLVVAIIIL